VTGGRARRVYCPAVRAELEGVLAERPPADRAFFDLFEAVNALEQAALTWCPALAGARSLEVLGGAQFRGACVCDRAARRRAGEHGLFVDGAGASVFVAPIEAYMGGVRAKLVQWTDRLLAEARAWPPRSC
jgi:hypothetical protein